MKKLMKVVSMAMVGLFALAPIMNVDAMTKFTSTDWNNEDGTYGSFTEVDDNVTNLKGNATDTGGQYYGPYSKSSTDTFEDGTITEEINVELDPEGWAQGEYFTLTTALNDDADTYVVENGIWAQKDGDAIYVWANWDATKIKVTEKGVYTFQYTYTKDTEANKIYFDFNLKLWDDVIGGFYDVDMDDPSLHLSGDTQQPVADHASSVRYVWFDNIAVANGINVYTELPEKPVDPEVPVNPVDPEVPTDEVKSEEVNPETSDGILLFLGLTVVGFAGVALTYRRLHN